MYFVYYCVVRRERKAYANMLCQERDKGLKDEKSIELPKAYAWVCACIVSHGKYSVSVTGRAVIRESRTIGRPE